MGFSNEQLERYSRHIILKDIGVKGQKKLAAAKVLIVGAMSGVIGTLQALETIKYITGAGELLTGRLLFVDALTMDFRTIRISHPRKD